MRERRLLVVCMLVTAAGVLVAASARPADAVSKRQGLIAVQAADGIYVVPAAGGRARKFPGSLPGEGNPVWSPDGRQMSFDRGGDSNTDVWVMNADGSGRRQLTFSPRDDDFARWSPRGRWLVFQSARRGAESVYAINVRTGAAQRVRQRGEYPDWLQNGLILFAWDGSLYTVRPTGDEVLPVFLPASNDALAGIVSRNGRKLVYLVPSGIGIANADGSGSRQLTGDIRDDDPVLSPDGKWVAFDRGDFVYVIRADGRQNGPELVALGCCPDWSFTASPP